MKKLILTIAMVLLAGTVQAAYITVTDIPYQSLITSQGLDDRYAEITDGLSDGTKDLNMYAATFNYTLYLNGTRINSTGNVGILDTPPSFGSVWAGISLGGGAVWQGYRNADNTGSAIFGYNFYGAQTTYQRKNNGAASRLTMGLGTWNLAVAASGNAESSISWTTSFTGDINGNVAAAYSLGVSSNLVVDGGISVKGEITANTAYIEDSIEIVNTINSTSASVNGLITAESISVNGIIKTEQLSFDGGTTALKCKVVSIGDWNMDTTTLNTLYHGVANTKIRMLDVIIRSDNGILFKLNTTDYSSGTYAPWGTTAYLSWTGNYYVEMYRAPGQGFDTTDFNATAYNRGWVTIWYDE